MTLILLGPSAWLRGYHPKVPSWVVEIHPPGTPPSTGPVPSAKDIRLGLVARLRLTNVRATLLELHADLPDEEPVDKLLRVVKEDHVDKFAIYWPYGAVRPAVDVEIGWLLYAMQRGDILAERVGVFYEWDPEGRKAAEERTAHEGRVVFEGLEREKRARAYRNVASRGAILIPWSRYEDLLEFLEVFAR